MSDRADDTREATEPGGGSRGGFRLWMVVPALGAAMVLAVFLLGLERDNAQELPSALIDEPAPQFVLEPLGDGRPGLSTADLEAPGIKLVNVWASWCPPCRAEHPQLMALGESGITLYGINYKDKRENAVAFLDEHGDPFERIGADTTGRTAIDFGVYGVPETFVIDSDGTIVYRRAGPILEGDIERYIMPAIEKAHAG